MLDEARPAAASAVHDEAIAALTISCAARNMEASADGPQQESASEYDKVFAELTEVACSLEVAMQRRSIV
jgi:hypothetical protein